MSHPVGDETAVRELARAFRREAQRVNELQHNAQRRAATTHWVGRRATQARAGVRAQNGPISRSSHELVTMARTLEEHATWIRDTIAELENLENRIRWWAQTHPPNPETPGPDASWIRWWPGRHSFSWRDLAHQLRSAGAYF